MSDTLHQKTAAAVAELRAIAEAGTPGDWEAQLPTLHMDGTTAGRIVPIGGGPAAVVGQFAPGVADLIVAAVNTLRRAIPAWEETLGRHHGDFNADSDGGYSWEMTCQACGCPIDDCGWLRSLARAVGVLEEE